MKSARLLFVLLTAGILATGCTKEYVTREYNTYVQQGLDMTLIDFNVKQENWAVRDVENGNANEGYFEAVLSVPEITQKVVDQGIVMVYRRYEDNVWTPLPAMRTEKTADGLYYTTYVDFEWGLNAEKKGYVSIYVTASDLYAGQNPGDMSFRVAIQL